MGRYNRIVGEHTSKYKGVFINKQKKIRTYEVAIKSYIYLNTQNELLAGMMYDYLILKLENDYENTNLNQGIYTIQEMKEFCGIERIVDLTQEVLKGKVRITKNLRKLLPKV